MKKIDTTKIINNHIWHRVAGVAFWISACIYLAWLVAHLNHQAWYVSYPFLLTHIFTVLLVSLSIINHWKVNYRTKRPEFPQIAPQVSVVIPTCGEPLPVIKKTLKSIIKLDYPGLVVIVVSNDDQTPIQKRALNRLVDQINRNANPQRPVFVRHSTPHGQAKAGNLNQAVQFIKQKFPHIDLIVTQDADEIIYSDFLKAIVGYFTDPKVAYVQTIKQSIVEADDPFGNQDLMFYGRTAPSRDVDNAMFSCGSGVMWRLSAVESIGGFNTWNLVEDLTTSYELLAKGWQSRYHFEALSHGLAPEDLPNFIKQRGTWAIDTMRLFFWNSPLFKKGLSFAQRLQFIEIPLFYLNGMTTVLLIATTSISLIFTAWPTTENALTHALYGIPFFLCLEIYFLTLAGSIPFHRIRQFWVGLAPVYALATIKALVFGAHKKPKYKVTRKQNIYDNYLMLVWPQVLLLGLLGFGLIKTIADTPVYSKFDWGAFFWGLYMASFFAQIIRVSWWKWNPEFNYQFELSGNMNIAIDNASAWSKKIYSSLLSRFAS